MSSSHRGLIPPGCVDLGVQGDAGVTGAAESPEKAALGKAPSPPPLSAVRQRRGRRSTQPTLRKPFPKQESQAAAQ